MEGARPRAVVVDSDKGVLARANRELTYMGVDVVGVTDNSSDAYRIIREMEPDIAFVNVVLPDENGFYLMNRLRNARLSNMPAVVMMTPLMREDVVARSKEAGAYVVIDVPTLPAGLQRALKEVKPLSRIVPGFARKDRIREILDGMSLDRTLKGYEYLVTAIWIACRSHKFYRAMTTIVYPETARLHGATKTGVERCIRHALDSAWTRGDLERQYAYFGNTIDGDRGKPTSSEFIARISEALRMEER